MSTTAVKTITIGGHSSDLTGLTTIEGMNIKLVIVLWYQH
jgi:hypothetical protein